MNVVTDAIRNGVDTGKLFATLGLIKAQPELARFQFRASNQWIGGAHNRSVIKGFYAAGGEDTTRSEEFELDAGEPAILSPSTRCQPTQRLVSAPRRQNGDSDLTARGGSAQALDRFSSLKRPSSA